MRLIIDAVVITDIVDDMRREFLGIDTDTHLFKDMTTGLQITEEGTVTDIGHGGQLRLGIEPYRNCVHNVKVKGYRLKFKV